MFAIFEPEEFVGQIWHRLVGDSASYPRHPEAAVALESMRVRLGVVFRALGGAGAVRLAGGGAEVSEHRLTLKQRLGLGTERIERASFDGSTIALPARIDAFPEREDNAALYEWLVAYFAHAPAAPALPHDPLQADLLRLRLAAATTRAALAAWPGLRPLHERLCRSFRQVRPVRRLPGMEAAVEDLVSALTGLPTPVDARLMAAVASPDAPLESFVARQGYRPFLPVPLWGEVTPAPAGTSSSPRDPDESLGGKQAEGDEQRRKGKRRDDDQTRRDDPLILNRFEKLLGLAEMVNLNRKTEDDDEENAKKAADDLDEISLGQHDKKPATKLRFDLDLPPEDSDTAPLRAELTYPEWDWKKRAYRPNHCRVLAEPASTEGEDWVPDEAARRRIRLVRRQFEALRPKRQTFQAQPDGDDIDLSALVRSLADRRAGGIGSERVYQSVRNAARDLAVSVLMDVSLSTDAWVDGHRVLDVEKEALLALTHGLTSCGDEHEILAFTSRKRDWISVRTVKGFDDRLDARVLRRIRALKPGYYTRIGAAVRHAAKRLEDRPHSHRLMLILTDGKPNDIDHYEGRYGIEDTRVAIQEARRLGMKVFGVTVDARAQDYFPYIFGPGAYAIFPHVARLPAALPKIYRQLTA